MRHNVYFKVNIITEDLVHVSKKCIADLKENRMEINEIEAMLHEVHVKTTDSITLMKC